MVFSLHWLGPNHFGAEAKEIRMPGAWSRDLKFWSRTHGPVWPPSPVDAPSVGFSLDVCQAQSCCQPPVCVKYAVNENFSFLTISVFVAIEERSMMSRCS